MGGSGLGRYYGSEEGMSRSALKRAAVLIGTLDNDEDPRTTIWRGVGFVAFVRHGPAPAGQHAGTLYLVTAKHCAHWLRTSYDVVRFRRKDGGEGIYRFADPVHWVFHPTDCETDVAITPITIPKDDLDLQVTHSLIENVTGRSTVPSNENVTQRGERHDDR